ncbi:hypothetical protein STAFG_0900 [Streptomyces afghaniensis 772]|uniref:Uncharacterized protein n=1 Tax=Streptomyces afghaniensis 772 TaxID=1283301 RepID=S4MY60_9ACTN|nr:hypothetical protein STAFG_0900 [Streptomyces afghaniensis 772]
MRPVGCDGAHGGLRVLDLCLGVRLAHGPILPRREHHGRVGKRGRERGRHMSGPVPPRPLWGR